MKRKAIRKDEYLAAALACLLPQAQRDELRAAKVPAQTVIRLFSPDHIGLHCFEAPDRDEWHNLTPALRVPHAEKSRVDTKMAAKVARLRGESRSRPKSFEKPYDPDWFPSPTLPKRPKRKIASRPWPKGRTFPFVRS